MQPAKRMWTPWRMAYVAGDAKEAGCVFCNRFHGSDDRAALILHRGAHCFIIMNLFPYATGHVMIVPNDHVADPEKASPDALREMADLLPSCLRAARTALDCAGFNIGINIGEAAGAGVADHMHEHIVPRWAGDANFMPMLASTMILPELPPVTYAKLRAEFERPNGAAIRLVVLDPTARRVLFERAPRNARLPAALLDVSVPVWRAAIDAAGSFGVQARVIDWAGAAMVGTPEPGVLLLQAASNSNVIGGSWESIDSFDALGLDDVDATVVGRLGNPTLREETE